MVKSNLVPDIQDLKMEDSQMILDFDIVETS
jgi:hypothetical protein